MLVNPGSVSKLTREWVLEDLLRRAVRLVVGVGEQLRDISHKTTGQVETWAVILVLCHGSI